MSAFQSKRMTRSYSQTIEGPPEAVFPLLCPVREFEWLDGWDCTMLYSRSGLAEEGAVFSTASPGEEDTVWVVTRHDPAARRVEFARFTPHSKTCILKIAVETLAADRSRVDIAYTYTSIAEAGNAFLDSWREESFLAGVRFWERAMNHFLKTGGKLRRDPV
jgi:hypothetical protein